MHQIFFLAVFLNLLSGLTLLSARLSATRPFFKLLSEAVSLWKARLLIGVLTLLTGLVSFFVTADGILILGDLLPATTAVAMGISLLSDFFRQNTSLPGDKDALPRPEWASGGYRVTLGTLGILAASLHFFLPERILL
jgi:hypothetical protein